MTIVCLGLLQEPNIANGPIFWYLYKAAYIMHCLLHTCMQELFEM